MRYIFKDGHDYLMVSTAEGLLLRMNATAARRFQSLSEPPKLVPDAGGPFEPTRVTVVPSLTCDLRCVYCPTRVTKTSAQFIDPDFCRAGCRFIARYASDKRVPIRVMFHGTGEPTLNWEVFTHCVLAAEEEAQSADCRAHMIICTAGQHTQAQAEYIADHFDEIQISLDGPADIHRRYRPRFDGLDSFGPALKTARLVSRRGRMPKINVTVSAESAPRMGEIVRFVAAEVGPSYVVFEALWPIEGTGNLGTQSPSSDAFLTGFADALEVGSCNQVGIGHSTISVSALMESESNPGPPMCLVPGGKIVAYDLPVESEDSLRWRGTYGYYNANEKTISLDERKVRALQSQQPPSACRGCLCSLACHGKHATRVELLPANNHANTMCDIYVGVLKLLLSRTTKTGDCDHKDNEITSVAKSRKE